MLFAIVALDKADAAPLRASTRTEHIAHLEAHTAQLVEVGPFLDGTGNPCGSLLLVDMADRAAAEAFVAADPYAIAGVFESVTVRGYRPVFRGGSRLK